MDEESKKIPKIPFISPSPVEESKSASCILEQTHNTSIENDEDVMDKENYSPSKYFGKRPSFEFKNLKNIEKITHRAQSAIQDGKSNSSISNFGKVEDSDGSIDGDMEGSKVHFSIKNIAHVLDESEVEVEDKPNVESDAAPKVEKKPKKSILKKTHFQEEICIDQIFIRDLNEDFIDQVCLAAASEGKHFSEKLGNCFDEHWKNIVFDGNKAIRFLQGIHTDNIRHIFKDGIEFNHMLSIISKLKDNLDSNLELASGFLLNFPTIRKFDIVASCLLPKEKNEIKTIIEKLEAQNILSKSQIDDLNKVYNI